MDPNPLGIQHSEENPCENQESNPVGSEGLQIFLVLPIPPPTPSLPTGASWSSRRSLRLSRVSRSWDEFQGMQTKLRINPQQSQIPGKFCLRENPTKGSRDRESFLDVGAGVWIPELAIPVLRRKVSQGKVLESSGWMDLDGPKSRRRVLFGSSTPDWILALEQPPLPSLDHTSLPKKESMD